MIYRLTCNDLSPVAIRNLQGDTGIRKTRYRSVKRIQFLIMHKLPDPVRSMRLEFTWAMCQDRTILVCSRVKGDNRLNGDANHEALDSKRLDSFNILIFTKKNPDSDGLSIFAL